MALKTRDDYLNALRKMRPNIYKFGELIEDVTTHPATKRTVESHCLSFDAAHEPALAEMYTTTSVFTGHRIHRWNSMMQGPQDLVGNMHMKRQNYRRTGTCTGGRCVGWNEHHVLWAVTQEIDAKSAPVRLLATRAGGSTLSHRARLTGWYVLQVAAARSVSGAYRLSVSKSR